MRVFANGKSNLFAQVGNHLLRGRAWFKVPALIVCIGRGNGALPRYAAEPALLAPPQFVPQLAGVGWRACAKNQWDASRDAPEPVSLGFYATPRAWLEQPVIGHVAWDGQFGRHNHVGTARDRLRVGSLYGPAIDIRLGKASVDLEQGDSQG
jgi:hypothetical protein